MDYDDPYLDDTTPGFVDGGDRFDKPVPNRRLQKTVRSVAAFVLAAMLAAAGTPVSWVTVLTVILMVLIWVEIWSPRGRDRDDVI